MSGAIPVEPEEFEPAWLTEALEQAGVARGATITALEFDGYVGTGQMSRNGRFRLTWSEPEGRPASAIVKLPSADPPTRAASFDNGAYANEYIFYSQIAPTVAVRTPDCWVAHFDDESKRCVLVMEDLQHSTQGDQFDGCSLDEAALVVEQAVGLHAPRWGDAELVPLLVRSDPEARLARTVEYYRAALGPCLARLGHNFSADVIGLVERFADEFARWAVGTDTPRTVVHGDFRPDNFLFGAGPDAPPLAIVDWQTMTLGLGPADLAYFLGGAFPEARRREIERDVLEEYRRRLNAAGVDYAGADCWRDYRWGTLHGVVIGVLATLLAAQTERGDRLFTLMITRHAQHAIDLDALALIE
jgi:hypothetical protein